MLILQPHLAHEIWDDTVEGGALVAEALLAGAEGAEVFSSLGHHIVTKLQKQNTPSHLLDQTQHLGNCPFKPDKSLMKGDGQSVTSK